MAGLSKKATGPNRAKLPKLTVPTLDLSGASRRHYRLKDLQKWVSELALSNTNRTAHQLVETFNNLNTTEYTPLERQQLHNTLRKPLGDVIQAMGQPLRQARLPLERKARYDAELLQQLLEGMASGYKLVISEMAMQTDFKQEDKLLLTEALYLATYYLSRRLMLSYSLFEAAPKNVWLDLNQVYYYAEMKDLHLEAIDEPYPDTPSVQEFTVDWAFKRLILLALADPYHLMHSELDDVSHLMSELTAACYLFPRGELMPKGMHVVDLTLDEGPRFVSEDMDWQPRDGRLIDISAMKKELEDQLQRVLRSNLSDPEQTSNTLVSRQQRDMLMRLIDSYHGSIARGCERVTTEARVQLSTGLNNCHHFMSNSEKFTPEMNALKLASADDKSHPEHKASFAADYKEALQKDRKHDHDGYTLHPWWQRNVSPMGISISCSEGDLDLDARVGEVVAYRFADQSSKRWQVGVVKWMKIRTEKGKDSMLRVGVMNLANGAVAAGVKAISGLGSGTDFFRALMIPKQVSLAQTRSIIVPAFVYDVNTMLQINMKQRLFHIRLTRMLISTKSFTQFEFSIVSD